MYIHTYTERENQGRVVEEKGLETDEGKKRKK